MPGAEGVIGIGSHVSILSASHDDERRHGRQVDDVPRLPEPDAKPDLHAQWDEIRGEWTRWHEELGRWVAIEALPPDDDPGTGTGQ